MLESVHIHLSILFYYISVHSNFTHFISSVADIFEGDSCKNSGIVGILHASKQAFFISDSIHQVTILILSLPYDYLPHVQKKILGLSRSNGMFLAT